ncbi:hypothetical protein EST38_g119 [Candolleomyces aberdarensis]|uniref:Uncharacterized protein n=1 Tax=Candolleomyces aberdarensis TaxID=2316362 RepID=A0A4Q2E1P1_9AGAR|nr:hypothetical protein EST38_g119 [Candolleomyces aberdarensis]
MVDFVSKNAGNALLYVYVQGRDAALQPPVIRQAKTILSNASRLKSVVINLQSMARHDGRMLVDMLFRDVIGSADNLEYLKIAAGVRFSDRCEPPLAGGVPSLRYLELIQFRVPWTSHLLQPTRLTHLLMRPAPPPTSEFYDFLRRALHLKTLHLEFNHKGVENPSPYDAESSVQLNSLESLEISSALHRLCTLLGRVRISPNNISHLVLDVFLPDEIETTEGINQFLLAWRHAIGNQHRDPISPECIRLSTTPSFRGEWTYGYAIQTWDTRYQNISLSTLLGLRYHSKTGLGYSPWAEIEVRSSDERFLDWEQFPFPNPVAFEQLWSLANLRILILNIELPRSYWPELALSLVLETLHIPAANVNGFVEFLLEQWSPPLAPAGTQSVQIPFPALRLFVVGAMTNHQEASDRIRTARRVVDALEKRALSCGDFSHVVTSPKLDSLEFNSCRTEIDSETLSRMSALATYKSFVGQVLNKE